MWFQDFTSDRFKPWWLGRLLFLDINFEWMFITVDWQMYTVHLQNAANPWHSRTIILFPHRGAQDWTLPSNYLEDEAFEENGGTSMLVEPKGKFQGKKPKQPKSLLIECAQGCPNWVFFSVGTKCEAPFDSYCWWFRTPSRKPPVGWCIQTRRFINGINYRSLNWRTQDFSHQQSTVQTLKMNGWNIIPWMFVSDHFPFQMGDL